jgi:hypothetical protein
MDNNMIHIDDLVRQRLRGGEEPDRPGAWMNMRELLDKEMPVTSGTNWRRIIGYFTAALLLTTVSVGGYHLYTSHISANHISGGGGGRNDEGQYTTSSNPSASLPTGLNAVAEPKASTSNTNTPAKANTSNTNTATNGNTSNYIASTVSKPASSTLTSTAASVRARSVDNQSSLTLAPTRSSTASTSDVASNVQQQPAVSQKASTSTPDEASSNVYASATTANRSAQSEPAKLAGSDVQSLPVAAPSGSGPAVASRTIPDIKYQSIEQLELVHRKVYDAGTDKTYYRIDTVPMGKFIKQTIIPKSEEIAVAETPVKAEKRGLFNRQKKESKPAVTSPAIAARSSEPKAVTATRPDLTNNTVAIVPAATISNKTTEEEVGSSIATLGAGAVKAKGFRLWNAEKFEATVDKVKSDLSRIEMHPGIMGGINASMFTPNALGGFQLGLTSLFVLNDWWSLMIEPKYMLRFNTGSSLRDDYKEVIDNSGSIQPVTYMGRDYWSYTWTDHTIQHNFNYDLISTIEIPVMLRYHWDQIYLQGGANLVFSSPIKATEVSQPLGDYVTHSELRPRTPDSQPGTFIDDSHPKVLSSDFGSRFGTGYVLSGGYMFSPAVYFDLRLATTFWNNSKTDGAKQVSKDLLRTPSIQLSVGYRFNGKH